MENKKNSTVLRNCISKVSKLFRTKSVRIGENEKASSVEGDENNVILRHRNTFDNLDNTNQYDIDKSLMAESEDVVTPLPSVCTSKPFAFGNGIRPEIVEIIKHMDNKSLRLNNLSMEDRSELMRRYEKEERAVFRNSNSCPSFSGSGLYERRMRENEHRLRLNIRMIEVFF